MGNPTLLLVDEPTEGLAPLMVKDNKKAHEKYLEVCAAEPIYPRSMYSSAITSRRPQSASVTM